MLGFYYYTRAADSLKLFIFRSRVPTRERDAIRTRRTPHQASWVQELRCAHACTYLCGAKRRPFARREFGC